MTVDCLLSMLGPRCTIGISDDLVGARVTVETTSIEAPTIGEACARVAVALGAWPA